MSDTIAAIATGTSVSAIGIIRISGPMAIETVSKLFEPMPKEARKLAYGELRSAEGELLDLCMCTISYGPESYTGEDTAELQCHGSPVVLKTVLGELFNLGVRPAKPGEFTKRAFLNGKLELTSAEAVADIIDAQTKEQAINAAAQLGGAIQNKLDKAYSDLTDICSHFHAVLDYPDEDIEEFEIQNYKSVIENVLDNLRKLADSEKAGEILKNGISTVIVGKPNSGKSSLLNCLLGYERAIVTNVPGTTRDTIEEKIKIGRLMLRLTDTAGIRDTVDAIEKIGVERSRAALNRAQLVICVVDGTTDDEPICENAIVVYNKCDLPGFNGGELNISAKTGEGIDKLKEAIQKQFPNEEIPTGEILTNERQIEAINVAIDYLQQTLSAIDDCLTPDIVLTEIEGAVSAIGELTGKSIREDITNKIFARFCVGK